MRPRLHLITGPTTTGKTARAVELAARTGASVIAVDRIQCHSALSVGSGRPSAEELRSTHRIYLCDRPVADGELPPALANDLLHGIVESLVQRDSLVILEGGSISLLHAIYEDHTWATYQWSYERLDLAAPNVFRTKAQARVRRMLARGARPSMLDEAAAASLEPRSREVLMGIVGYRTLCRYAQARVLPVSELARRGTPYDMACLTDEIVDDYLAYALRQERELPKSAISDRCDLV
jgi:hypothetical protein